MQPTTPLARFLTRRLATALLLLAPAWWPAQAGADFPTRPLRIVVPTPAGGPSDTVARLVAKGLSAQLGQPVVVDNKAGASGAIAAQEVVRSPADGHTLLWAQSSMAGLPLVQKGTPYRDLGELAPVCGTVAFGYALFVSNHLPVHSIAELAAYGRAHPGQLNYATGTLSEHMFAVHVLQAVGVQATRVPYKGGAQLMPDLISGVVQLNFGPIVSGLQHAQAGKLRLLATVQPGRGRLLPTVPTVPTLTELGIATDRLPTWNALFAPPTTPTAVTERLAAAVGVALKAPAVQALLAQQGAVALGGGPGELAATVRSTTGTWQAFVREHNIPQE